LELQTPNEKTSHKDSPRWSKTSSKRKRALKAVTKTPLFPFSIIPLGSSKEDLLEQRDTVNNPVNITQENSIMKLEFLLAVFENFKSCLIFSTKYRVSTDFNQFFESESLRVNQLLERSMRKETSQNLHQSRLKTGEDSLRERGGSPQVRSGKLLTNVSHKSLASEANSMNAAAEKKQTTQPAPESQNNIKNE